MEFVICTIFEHNIKNLEKWLSYHFNLGFSRMYICIDSDDINLFKNSASVYLDNIVFIDTHSINKSKKDIYNLVIEYKLLEGDFCLFSGLKDFLVLEEGETLDSLISLYDEKYNGLLLWKKVLRIDQTILNTDREIEFDYKDSIFLNSRVPYVSFIKISKLNAFLDSGFHKRVTDTNCNRVDRRKERQTPVFSKAWIGSYLCSSFQEYCEILKNTSSLKIENYFNIFPEMEYIKTCNSEIIHDRTNRIAICTMIKDENDYLEEWLEWHISMGFTDIYLIEDTGSKSHKDIVLKYNKVHLILMDDISSELESTEMRRACFKQLIVFEWFCRKYLKEIDWCLFSDVDEFLEFEDKNYTLKDFIKEYEGFSSIYLPWKLYGYGGNIFKPKGRVVNNYDANKKQIDLKSCWGCKTFVNLRHGLPFWESNHCTLLGWCANKEFGYDKVELKKVWLRHYITKSWEEYCKKIFLRGDLNKIQPRKLDYFFKYNKEYKLNKEEFMLIAEENKWLKNLK